MEAEGAAGAESTGERREERPPAAAAAVAAAVAATTELSGGYRTPFSNGSSAAEDEDGSSGSDFTSVSQRPPNDGSTYFLPPHGDEEGVEAAMDDEPIVETEPKIKYERLSADLNG